MRFPYPLHGKKNAASTGIKAANLINFSITAIVFFNKRHMTPCSSIARATFMKPAMLAPLT